MMRKEKQNKKNEYIKKTTKNETKKKTKNILKKCIKQTKAMQLKKILWNI